MDHALDVGGVGRGASGRPAGRAVRCRRGGHPDGPGGRTSRFHVTAVEPEGRCAYEVPLVGARLVLERTLDGPGPWRVRHEVAFVGPLAPVWALLLGRGFRRQLGPTVDGLLALAESPTDP